MLAQPAQGNKAIACQNALNDLARSIARFPQATVRNRDPLPWIGAARVSVSASRSWRQGLS